MQRNEERSYILNNKILVIDKTHHDKITDILWFLIFQENLQFQKLSKKRKI